MSEVQRSPLGRNNFDFLRFVLASMVVLSHSYPLATGNEDHEPLAVLTGHQLDLGQLAVDCFFIISGFLITHSWVAKPDVRAYLSKRIRRIYPGFIVAAAFGAFVVTPLFSDPKASGFNWSFAATFVGNTLRLHDSVPGPAFQGNLGFPGTVNGSLWSISYEFWCYIGVLLCGLSGVLRRPALIWTALVVSIALSFAFKAFNIHLSGGIVGTIFGYPPFWARLLPFFLVGMAFYVARDRIRLNALGCAIAVLALSGGTLVSNGLIVVLPVAAAYLLLWLAVLPIPHLRRFARHGDLSYGVYLYSFPIQQIVAYLHHGKMQPLVLFVMTWPLSVLAAAASWYLIERWFIARKGPSHGEGSRSRLGEVLASAPH